jgi:hypothetical protein
VTCECSTTLCVAHQQSLDVILADIPDRLSTMSVTISKQSVMGGQGGRPVNDDDRPLPVNLGAADANQALRAELVNLTVRVQHCLTEQPRNRTMLGVTAWLRALMPRIAKHPESVSWYETISKAYERTTKAIDIAPERVRAGKCDGCSATLYTVEGRETVTCKPCATTYDVWELQYAELEKIRGYAGTAAQVLRALNHAEVKLKMRKLTYWADRGVVPTIQDERGRIYRVGDVLDAMDLQHV